jgi:hypothetical protein
MARRNVMRSWLAASCVAFSAAAVVAVAPAPPAGAQAPVKCDVEVTLKTVGFDPPTVWVRPEEVVCFRPGPGVDTNHTVTLDAGRCARLPNELCEKSFENYDPRYPPAFRFSTPDTYPYFDRVARDNGDDNMRGRIIVTNDPPPTAAPPSTTTTTAAVPRDTTTTTAAGSIHPFLVNDPASAPTTTTTTPAHLSVITLPAAAKSGDAPAAAASAKARTKGAADPGTTTTTVPPATPDTSIFDEASLIPSPVRSAGTAAAEADAAVDDVTSPAADLIHSDHAENSTGLLVVALGALAAFLLGSAIIAWWRRSSRYFPA